MRTRIKPQSPLPPQPPRHRSTLNEALISEPILKSRTRDLMAASGYAAMAWPKVQIAIDASASQAPAPRDGWHDYKFVNLLKAQDAAHLAIFLYDVPLDDATDRKADISRSLTNCNRDAQIFVETAGYESDAGPHGEAFAKNYGATLRALLDGPPPLCLAAAPSAR